MTIYINFIFAFLIGPLLIVNLWVADRYPGFKGSKLFTPVTTFLFLGAWVYVLALTQQL